MINLMGFLSFVFLAVSAGLWARRGQTQSWVLSGLLFWNIACAQIVLWGFVLGKFHRLADVGAWFVGTMLWTLLAWIWPGRPALTWRWRDQWAGAQTRVRVWRTEDPIAFWLLLPLALGFLLITLYHIVLCCLLAPTNHDSMTYILPRVAHYLQQGSLDYYDCNFIAQTVHFKTLSVLQIYTYLATGRNENALQFISLFSSWAAMLSVYIIARQMWTQRAPAVLATLLFGTFTSVLMIAVTPQSDMPITGFFGSAVAFLLTYSRHGQRRYLVGAMTSMALALGVKASALLLMPSFILIGLFALFRARSLHLEFPWLQPVLVAGGAAVLVTLLFLLPTGYLDNWQRYGHIMGPIGWREAHTMEKVPLDQRRAEGTRNFARYLIHFCSLDGFPYIYQGPPLKIQAALRRPLDYFFTKIAGVDIHSQEYTRQPFLMDYNSPNEDLSYWGLATLWFVLPALFLALGSRVSRGWVAIFLTAAFIYFWAQSYLSLYDPWRGRSFMNLGIFLAPLTGVFFALRPARSSWRYLKNIWVGCGLALVCFSGLNAGFFRYSSPIWTRDYLIPLKQRYIFQNKDRIWQMTRSNPWYYQRFVTYEQTVPPQATVVLAQVSSVYNYPLYGEGLSRTLLFADHHNLPEQADYVLFTEKWQPARAEDIPLDQYEGASSDEKWFLRKLR
jgi:hypothetical protein